MLQRVISTTRCSIISLWLVISEITGEESDTVYYQYGTVVYHALEYDTMIPYRQYSSLGGTTIALLSFVNEMIMLSTALLCSAHARGRFHQYILSISQNIPATNREGSTAGDIYLHPPL